MTQTKATIHGENILVPVEALPKGKVTKHNLYMVGHSESGHHHVLEAPKGAKFSVVEDMMKQVFIEVTEPSQLVHKKSFDIHETLTVEPGVYRIAHAVEYNPFTKKLAEVWD